MSGSGRSRPSNENMLLCAKYFLFAFNVISFLTATAVFTLGIWIRYDWDFKQIIHELEMYQFWTGDYILIVAAAIVMAMSFVGCCASVMENPFLLALNGGMLIIVFILEMAGLAYILDNGTLWSDITTWLEWKFYTLINEMDYNARSARILRIVQVQIGCCGSYSSLDYINVNKPVPIECRSPVTGNEYVDGCYIRLSRYLESRSGWIAGVALFLAVLQVLGIIVSFVMRRMVIKLEKDGKMYNPVKKGKV